MKITNKLILIALIIFVVVIVFVHSEISTSTEINSGEKNCMNRTSGNSILIKPMIDMICDEACRPDLYTYTHGHTYHGWKCSDEDTIVCVCNL